MDKKTQMICTIAGFLISVPIVNYINRKMNEKQIKAVEEFRNDEMRRISKMVEEAFPVPDFTNN